MRKKRLILVSLLFILWSLLVPASLVALAPIKGGAESEEEAATLEKEPVGKMSKEEAAAIEKKIMEDIEKTIEEKKGIIEKARKERRPIKRMPFVAEEERPYLASPLKRVEPLERHNILLGQNPFAVILTLILLSFITYLLYRLVLQKLGK